MAGEDMTARAMLHLAGMSPGSDYVFFDHELTSFMLGKGWIAIRSWSLCRPTDAGRRALQAHASETGETERS